VESGHPCPQLELASDSGLGLSARVAKHGGEYKAQLYTPYPL